MPPERRLPRVLAEALPKETRATRSSSFPNKSASPRDS